MSQPNSPERPLEGAAGRALTGRLGVAVWLLALVVATGWLFDIELLRRLVPGLPEMGLDTAIGFALAGMALRLRASERERRVAAAAAVAGLLLVGSAVQLVLAGSAPDSIGASRISPVTAVSFGLVAAAVMIDRRWPRLTHALALVVFTFGLIELLAFVYDIAPLQRWRSFEGMALHVSLGTLAAALGALFLRSDIGIPAALLDDSIAGAELRHILPVAIGVPLALGALARAGDRAGLWSDAYDTAILATATMIVLLSLTAALYRSLRDSEAAKNEALASLGASEHRFRTTFEHATIGIAHLSAEGRWLRANERLCEILGYAESELIELTYAAVSHLEDLDVDVKQWELLRRGEIDAYGVERRFRSKSGEEIVAEVRLVREEDAAGQLLHFIVVVQDITGRKISEGTLRVYQRALAAARNGIVITDAAQPDHPIRYANDAFLEITGYEASEVLGRNCRFLNEKARDQAAVAEVRDAVAKGEPCSVLIRNHRKDGTGFWNRLAIAPVEGADGSISHFVGIMSDATESVRAGAERDELLRVAESANRAKDRFLAVVSHELRSPLNAILAWSSILEEEAESEVVSRASTSIAAAVRSQSRLIDDLLDASRIRGQQLDVQKVRIELSGAVEEIVEQMRAMAEERFVDLVFEASDRPVFADADPERIAQIVRNLLDNALKFTPEGGRIAVALTGDDRWIDLTVRDTGPGLTRPELDQIFDEFWQGAPPGSAGVKGLGLGLPIVRHLVERHGGRIEAKSEGPGRGLTMAIRLPRPEASGDERAERRPDAVHAVAASELPRRGRAAAVEHAGNGTRDDLTGLEIVVVDDDPAWVEATSTALAKRKAIVRSAHSVAEAMRHFERGSPDLLVSDIGLPDRSGLDLIGAVRRMAPPAGAILAIAVTGMTDVESRARVRRAGFDACLCKPIPAEVVLDEIVRLRTLVAAEDLPAQRVLVVADGNAATEELVGRLKREGHVVELATGAEATSARIGELRPRFVVIQAPLDALEPDTIAERALSVDARLDVVVIAKADEEIDPEAFDLVLSGPAAWETLTRFVRLAESTPEEEAT